MSEVTDLPRFGVVRVRADNPGPLTLSGTNTWVVGRDPAWIVDPGPSIPEHLEAVAAVAGSRGGAGGIAVTHDHADHAEAAEPLAERLGVAVGHGPFEVLPLPGHADDHVVFLWEGVAFTGDAVLGEGSVFVDGDMAGYLDGLRRLRDRAPALLCPGHGPPVEDAVAHIEGYLAHRLDRERRLLEALERGLRSEDELLDAAWSEVPAVLRPVAALTLRAHLRKLEAEGRALGGRRRAALGHAAPGEVHRRRQRRRPGGLGLVEDLAHGVADRAHALVGARLGVAALLELDGDVDDAAGVDDEVGRPQDPAVGEHGVHRRVGELVVGGARDDPGLQPRHGVVVQRPAQGARGDARRRRRSARPAARPTPRPARAPACACSGRRR